MSDRRVPAETSRLGLTAVGNPLSVDASADTFGPASHAVPRWSETSWFGTWSPNGEVGIFLHIGRMPGDLDLWWAQLHTYLPDGMLAIDRTWGRSTIDHGVDAGNLHLRVQEPLRHWSLTLDGAGELVSTHQVMRGLVGAGPQVPVRWDIDAVAAGPAWDLRPRGAREMPRWAGDGHTQQTFLTSGEIVVGGTAYEVNGVGYNDHSRGVRDLSHFGADQWMIGILPGATFHTIDIWGPDGAPNLTVGNLFEDDGVVHDIHVASHGVYAPCAPCEAHDVTIERTDGGPPYVIRMEVLHTTAISVTQRNENLNGTGWDLPDDTLLFTESAVRLTAASGEIGYGHLERAARRAQHTVPE